MKRIKLTQGKFALIDDEDYGMVSLFKWYADKGGDTFYAQTVVMINKERIVISMHRLLLNAKPNELSDHRDMDGLNNQRYNLRKCTYSQNRMNIKSYKNSYSKYKGVTWHKRHKKWMAQVKFNGKLFFLGYRNLETERAELYDKKAKELFGEFARLNTV